MKLTELYKLRQNFTIIGLTGRTGSGCSKIAAILTGDLVTLQNGVRDVSKISNPITSRKIEICLNFLSYQENWKPFEEIKYKNVLLFYLISFIGIDRELLRNILLDNYKEETNENNEFLIEEITEEIFKIVSKEKLVREIIKLKDKFKEQKTEDQLMNLERLFFGKEFREISGNIFNILEERGYYKRTLLLHHISCNIRSTGEPLNSSKSDISNIYVIAELINRLIKAKKLVNDKAGKPTKIIINSLRNSLEIMFFKERYSAFYMLAAKEGNNRNKDRVIKRLPAGLDETEKNDVANKLLELDAIEYRTGDHSKGRFASPDVYNCIQKSEIHIVNRIVENEYEYEDFNSVEEQILKTISLIQQPGIITPSSSERCMQIAYNAKLNSGCISRQVGAVVTDSNYSIKAVGWNDVPQGQTPCCLRNANDFFAENLSEVHYTNFERGEKLESIDIDYKYKNSGPKIFPQAVKDYFDGQDLSMISPNLEGKNCSFCFKSIHNNYEGEKNQVHTKSLHAEENAMLQITKYGGQALKNGFLFTTASPCELCSKKAMQLGITKVFYIDPYPGISEPQILSNNRAFSMELVHFNGAIGKAYNKLYEPFMAYKDEVAIMLENVPKKYDIPPSSHNILSQVSHPELKGLLEKFFVSGAFNESELIEQLKK